MVIDLDSYLVKSAKINSVKELFDHYNCAIKEFGYDHNAFIFFPPRQHSGELTPVCPFFDAPQEIISNYLYHKLYMVGPMFELAKTTGRPVIWSDFLNDSKKSEKSPQLKIFFELLKNSGIGNGLTIPVFGFSSSFGHFSFSKKDKKIEHDDPNLVLLNHVCIDLFREYIRITNLDKYKGSKLTSREKEVLGWVLQDKSNSVIAEILGISEHTVTTYIRRSSHKLGASSKWGAAITAVLMGLVQY